MAHKITPVLKPKGGQSSAVEVPQEVKDEIDEFFAYLIANPDQEGFVEFDDEKEAGVWERQVRTYGATREAGAIKYRRLPSKHLPANQLRFQLTRDIPADGERKGKK